ncbi:MAG: tetratricopeptide repeat protein [Myxococcales bacterium]|nr:tetratricopeptide repeat protein [Myxococcales bacterium]
MVAPPWIRESGGRRIEKSTTLEDFDCILDQAWDTYEAGNADRALELYNRAIHRWPERAEPWYEKGLILKETGQPEAAMDCFERVLRIDPDDYRAMVKKADMLIWDHGEFEAGYELCREARKRGPDLGTLAEIAHWSALALLSLGRFDEALKEIDQGIRKGVPSADDYSLRGEILLRKGEAKMALGSLNEAIVMDPGNGYFHYLYGCAHLYLAKEAVADRHFRRAAELDPDNYRIPCRLRSGEFDALVNRAVTALPAWVQRHLENVEISVEDLPPTEDLVDGLDFDVLGAYYGFGDPNGEEADLPERIILFQKNIETFCGGRDELRKEIEKTVIHEVAHRFNIDDEQMPPEYR